MPNESLKVGDRVRVNKGGLFTIDRYGIVVGFHVGQADAVVRLDDEMGQGCFAPRLLTRVDPQPEPDPLAVLRGSYGCLTDDCQYWDVDSAVVCQESVPCLLGRKLRKPQPQVKPSEAPQFNSDFPWKSEYAKVVAECDQLRAALSVATKALEPFANYGSVVLRPHSTDSILLTDMDHCHENAIRKSHFYAAATALFDPAIADELESAQARAERHTEAVLRVNELTTEVAELRANVARSAERTRALEEERDTYERDIRVLAESGCQQATQLAEQGWRLRSLEEVAEAALAKVARLSALLNTPETEDFDKAVPLEAAHQVLRWGAKHDTGKSAEDWFWLVGYLAGKALAAGKQGDQTKALHHCISTAAALRNWHAHIRSGLSEMRPGISVEQQIPDEALAAAVKP